MTSSALEWDYYEFEPVETSSLEYATPGASSLLLPANPANAHWSTNAISDWSMSSHTAPTSEIVQDPVAMGKGTKEEKSQKNQRRQARKNPRRSEREKEVSNCFVHLSCLELPCNKAAYATWEGFLLKRGRGHPCMTGVSPMSLALEICLHCAHSFPPCRREHVFQNQVLDRRGCKPFKICK